MIRPYAPGDDVRRIDWNVTARTGEPHVRVDLAERVLVTWLVLDTSVSMEFGTADRRKADVAEGVAVAIGHLVHPAREPARRRHVRRRRAIARFRRTRGAWASSGCWPRCAASRSDGGSAETSFARRASPNRCARAPALARRGRLGLPRPARLAAAAARSSRASTTSIAVEVRDVREQELPNVGLLYLVDPETGRQLRVDTRSRRLRERFAAAAAAPSARSSRARSRPSASGTSSSEPRATGCARSSRSCAGAAGELPLAARPDGARGAAVLVALYIDRDRGRVASQARVRQPRPHAERRRARRLDASATCRRSCCSSRSRS